MGEPVTSFGHSASGNVPVDTNGLLGAFGGVTGEKTGSADLLAEERPARGLGLRDRTAGGLVFIVCALAIVAMIHYRWLSFGSSLHAQVVPKTTPEIFVGIIGAEDGSAITANLAMVPWNDINSKGLQPSHDPAGKDTLECGLRQKMSQA